MYLTLEVSLLSGRTVSLEAGLDESVAALRRKAQKTLAVGRGRLLSSSGGVLSAAATLEESSLRNGDRLTLQMRSVYVRGNEKAFAAILGDGSVVAWGNADCGGDNTAVPISPLGIMFLFVCMKPKRILRILLLLRF